MTPSIREYGGGFELWALYRHTMILPLWDALCHGEGSNYTFAEFDSEEAALAALEAAGKRLRQCEEAIP